MADIADALTSVDSFETHSVKELAWNLDRAETLARLRALLRNPELLNQKGLNVCGPAAFFRLWLARDPSSVALFACELLGWGSANIGPMVVRPRPELRAQDYSKLRGSFGAAQTPDSADWMMLSALRDSENLFLPYMGEPGTVVDKVSGITLPSTLQGWLTSTNLYSSVTNDTNVLSFGDLSHLIKQTPSPNLDVVVLTTAACASGVSTSDAAPTLTPPVAGFIAVPDHYISMTDSFFLSPDQQWLRMNYWCWGENRRGWQGHNYFAQNYFGLLAASV